MNMSVRQVVVAILLAIGGVAGPVDATQQTQSGRLPPQVGEFAYSHDLGDRDAFGVITAVAPAGDSAFAVLDAMNSRVGLYSLDGTLMARFGAKGRGPGEFFLPTALVPYASELLVLDRGNVRLIRLQAHRDTMILRGQIKMPLANASDVCTIGGRIFLAGFHNQHLIHEIDVNGDVINAFGSAFPSDPTAGDLSGIGKLACSTRHDRIAYVSRPLNGLRIFAADGDSVWAGDIPGFVGQEYEFQGSMMRPQRPSRGFTHNIEAFQWLDTGHLLIQLKRSNDDHNALHESRMWNDRTNSWSTTGPRWPTALLVDRQTVLFKEEAPYPIIKMYHER